MDDCNQDPDFNRDGVLLASPGRGRNIIIVSGHDRAPADNHEADDDIYRPGRRLCLCDARYRQHLLDKSDQGTRMDLHFCFGGRRSCIRMWPRRLLLIHSRAHLLFRSLFHCVQPDLRSPESQTRLARIKPSSQGTRSIQPVFITIKPVSALSYSRLARFGSWATLQRFHDGVR